MNRIRHRAMVVFGVASLLWAGTVGADSEHPDGSRGLSKKIIGVYGMTFTQTCVLAPFQAPPAQGFDPDTKSLMTDAEIVSAVSSGVVRFHRDGRMTIEDGLLTEIFNARVSSGDTPVVTGSKYTCDGSYEVNAKGHLSAELVCRVIAPQPGVEVTIQPFRLEGFVSKTAEHITLNAIDGNIQLVSVAVQGQVVQERERICLQNLSLARLRGKLHHGDGDRGGEQ